MKSFPSRAEVMMLRKLYPQGTIIRLISMDDPYSKLRPGDRGKVVAVDDAGQLLMTWESGSSLSLIPGVDHFETIKEENK